MAHTSRAFLTLAVERPLLPHTLLAPADTRARTRSPLRSLTACPAPSPAPSPAPYLYPFFTTSTNASLLFHGPHPAPKPPLTAHTHTVTPSLRPSPLPIPSNPPARSQPHPPARAPGLAVPRPVVAAGSLLFMLPHTTARSPLQPRTFLHAPRTVCAPHALCISHRMAAFQ